jgi:hypothetical protein
VRNWAERLADVVCGALEPRRQRARARSRA